MERDWLKIVQNLIAQAEDLTIGKAESEAFMEKAADIMAKHGIDRAMAEAAKPVKEIITSVFRNFPAPFAKGKLTLYTAIAKNFSCSPIIIGKGLHVFGFPSDLDAVDELYTILLLHGVNALGQIDIWGNATAFRNAWWLGYSNEISERLKKASKKETDNTPGSAIVLRNRAQASKDALNSEYPTTRQVTRHYSSGSGYLQGKAEGSRVGLGNARVGTPSRPALH